MEELERENDESGRGFRRYQYMDSGGKGKARERMDGTRTSGGGNISTDPCHGLQDLGDLGAATRRAMERSCEVSPLERLGEWHPGGIQACQGIPTLSGPIQPMSVYR